MPLRHGSKFYLQVLLDPNRFTLLQMLAEKEKVKVTALARDAIYAYLAKIYPASDYNAAEASDKAEWAESVKRRVQGRMQARKASQA
jgi:hypothetical protein